MKNWWHEKIVLPYVKDYQKWGNKNIATKIIWWILFLPRTIIGFPIALAILLLVLIFVGLVWLFIMMVETARYLNEFIKNWWPLLLGLTGISAIIYFFVR